MNLSNSYFNYIYGNGGSGSLTNPAGNTIQGAGQIGINEGSGFAFTLTNNGTIDANQSNSLTVAPYNTLTSSGTLEATSGGTLIVNNPSWSSTGTLSASAGSTLDLQGGFTATSLTNNGTTNVSGNGTINTITGSGTLAVNGSSNTLKLAAGSAQSSQASFTVNSGSTLDLTNNSIIINVTGNMATAYTYYQGLVNQAYNGGAWTGTGITSSTAAAQDALTPNTYGVAVVNGADGQSDHGSLSVTAAWRSPRHCMVTPTWTGRWTPPTWASSSATGTRPVWTGTRVASTAPESWTPPVWAC